MSIIIKCDVPGCRKTWPEAAWPKDAITFVGGLPNTHDCGAHKPQSKYDRGVEDFRAWVLNLLDYYEVPPAMRARIAAAKFTEPSEAEAPPESKSERELGFAEGVEAMRREALRCVDSVDGTCDTSVGRGIVNASVAWEPAPPPPVCESWCGTAYLSPLVPGTCVRMARVEDGFDSNRWLAACSDACAANKGPVNPAKVAP